MKKVSLLAALLLGVSTIRVTDSIACGDKLLTMGRSVRYHLFHPEGQPVSILLYRNDTVLETAIKHGGYKLHVAKNITELASNLRSKNVEVTVADPSDVPAIKGTVESAPTKPVLIALALPSPKAKEGEYIAIIKDAVRQRRK